jgi:hypothetical protein
VLIRWLGEFLAHVVKVIQRSDDWRPQRMPRELNVASGNDTREAHLVGAKQNSKERDLGTAAKKPSINTVCNGYCFAVALKLISNVPQESGLSDPHSANTILVHLWTRSLEDQLRTLWVDERLVQGKHSICHAKNNHGDIGEGEFEGYF